ncbi:hypothetical protein JCM8547_004185 [Rhodosporidiobolus lusitaniae]
MVQPPFSSSLSTSPSKYSAPLPPPFSQSSRPPHASTNSHSLYKPPLASTSFYRPPAERNYSGSSSAAGGGFKDGHAGGTGVSAIASRGTSPSRKYSGDDLLWAVAGSGSTSDRRPSRAGSGGEASSSSGSAPPSRKSSAGDGGGEGHERREPTDPGVAGRGAGGYGLGRAPPGPGGKGLPVLNTYLLPQGGGMLSPAGSSNQSHGSSGEGYGASRRERDSFALPKPLHPPPSSTSGSTTSPSTTSNSFPRSPSFPHRHSPTPSPTFPPSHSNSTLSSHSHSQHSALSPTSSSFPHSSQPFLGAPSSRPGSAASQHRSSGSRSQNPSSSADGHDPSSSSSLFPSPHPSSSSRSQGEGDRSRSRGNSGDSAESSHSASSSGVRAPSRERERRREGGGGGGQTCAKCELPMTGQFVRALGTVYHLDCFRCLDCNKVVAAKFFPIDDPSAPPPSSPSPPRQVPLCETDYFRRLNLLCNKCGQALRGSYITALDMKFHVEHFTCSVCPTVFGPQDSYYEHAGSVYCHFHYSTRFAVKCTGCRTAILKQFVEINRNSVDEHWHPECYMIHKFWNIKLAPAPKVIERPPSVEGDPSSPITATSSGAGAVVPSSSSTSQPPSSSTTTPTPDYLALESLETPQSLKSRQKRMEEQVYRIWTILSAFEESSAACISEMLRHVSGGHYMEGVGMAEKFVLHVETLFAAIDDLNRAFRAAGAKEMAHVREARMLCKKVVNFFMLLSHTHETGARKMSITQELLSLVTGLAHYLKILIRIALTGSLRLEREWSNPQAIGAFLGRLDRLARDPEANRISSTTAALARGQQRPPPSSSAHDDGGAVTSRKNSTAASSDGGHASNAFSDPSSPPPPSSSSLTPTPSSPSSSTKQPYGYLSLTRAVGTLVGQGEATTDLCEGCRLTVEEECARWGTSRRWHLGCLRCGHCGRGAGREEEGRKGEKGEKDGEKDGEKEEVPIGEYVWVEEGRGGEDGEGEKGGAGEVGATFCKDCARRERGGSLEGCQAGFEYVTRLEQYAFLLCVALNKLFGRLKQRGVVPGSPPDNDDTRSLTDAYRDSTDIKRMKSVQLDRKLSSTMARLPKRSTVVQSPSGRTAQSDDSSFALFQAKPPVPSRKDQPIVDPVRGTVIPRNNAAPHPPPSSVSTSTTSTAKPTGVPLAPSSSSSSGQPHPSPQRPLYNRATTAVRIVDEPLPISSDPSSSLHGLNPASENATALGGAAEPTQDEDGLTLADLPKALEAEQKRAAYQDPAWSRQAPSGLMGAGRASPPWAAPPVQSSQPGSASGHGDSGRGTYRGDRPNNVDRDFPPSSSGVHFASSGPKLLSELSALEYLIVKHVAAVVLASESSALSSVVTLEELLEIIDARKNTFWGKLFKGGEKKKEVKKKGVFGIPLEILVERNGADSMHGAGPGSLRIPSFVDDVISSMKQMDMSIEGIFRKNGNIRRLKDLTEALDRDSGAVNLSDDNPVQLAALLKKFLRDLPDPLMTFKLFHLFIAAQRIPDDAERKKVLHFVCCLLPKHHRDTMEVLFVFLKWVASFSHVDEETGSKMDLQNLATVISPNILYAKGKDPARDESFSAARVVHELLELQDEFWEVPAECLSILNDQELFSNPSQLTSKEILARAENHVRLHGRGGFKNSGVHISRGEASGPQRPGLQEAWSAPAVPGASGPNLRPLSTSVSPSSLRPLSISNQLGLAANGSHPHLPSHHGLPGQSSNVPPRSGASTPGIGAGSASNGAGGWQPGPPPAGRYEEPYRRGGSEGNASSSSLHRIPQQQQQQQQQNSHPYAQPVHQAR